MLNGGRAKLVFGKNRFRIGVMSDDEDAAPVDPRQYIQRGKVVEPRRRTGKRTNKTPNNTAEQQKSPRPLSKNRNKSLPTLKEESASAYSTIRGLYHKTGRN